MAVRINGDEVDQMYTDLGPLLPSEPWPPNMRNRLNYPLPQTPAAFVIEEDTPDPVVMPASYLTNINPALLMHPSFHHLASSYSPSQFMSPAPFLSPSPFSFVGMIPGPDDLEHVSHGARGETVQGTDVGLNSQADDPPELQRTVPVNGSVRRGSRRLGENSQGDDPAELEPSILVEVDDLVHDGSPSSRASRRDILQETPQLRFLRLMEASRSNAATARSSRTGTNHPDTNPDTLMNNILALEAARREKLKIERENGTTSSEKKNDEGCKCCADFECNICFETSVDPVVTQCGHLFCWRCLYKWMSIQLLGISECPVCKGEVTDRNVTPIYGRGGSSSAPEPVPGEEVEQIPPRPSGRRTDSTRQLMRRESGRGFMAQDVQRVRTDLEAVLARLRQMPRPDRASNVDIAEAAEAFAGTMRRIGTFRIPVEGEDLMEVGVGRRDVRGERDAPPESEAGSSVPAETHVRRRRRYSAYYLSSNPQHDSGQHSRYKGISSRFAPVESILIVWFLLRVKRDHKKDPNTIKILGLLRGEMGLIGPFCDLPEILERYCYCCASASTAGIQRTPYALSMADM